VTGSADPSLTIAYRVVQPVAVTGIAAAVSPEVVGGYWEALTLGTHSVSLVLGHRPGVREADLLQLEDESGSWLFESGEFMGFETSLTLPPRALELSLEARE
jgi:hypothetical protein